MSDEQQDICRICLKVAENEFEKIDEVIKQMFNILLLKLDLDITIDPIICQNCVEIAKKCLKFKYTYITTEKIILLFSIGRENTNQNIKVIYKNVRKDVVTVIDADLNICRFCMNRLESNNFAYLDTLINEPKFEMLSEYMPEMDFHAVDNPIICPNCREDFEGYFKFVLNCLNLEARLKAYCKEEETDSMGPVKLGNIMNFLSKYLLEYADKSLKVSSIKEESNTFDYGVCVYSEVYTGAIKHEELNIKGEIKSDGESYKKQSDTVLEPKPEDSGNRLTLAQKNSLELQSYMSIHEDSIGIKIYNCSRCPYKSKHRRYLLKHILVHKDVPDIKMYKCSLCAYKYKQNYQLKRHMLVHKDVSEIKMYKCSSCAYESKHKSSLKRHTLLHKDISEIKTYNCTLCAYKGRRISSLERHMLVHKDVSEIHIMYKCSSCAYETTEKNTLKTHMFVHKDLPEIKIYNCTLCAYKTERTTSLKTHMLVHIDISELKMHKCSLCSYETKQKGNLKTHMLVHKDVSELKMHKCLLCSYEAKRKGDLKKHIMLLHKDIPETKIH